MPASHDLPLRDFGETRLDSLQRHAFEYFLQETSPANGLVADTSHPGSLVMTHILPKENCDEAHRQIV